MDDVEPVAVEPVADGHGRDPGGKELPAADELVLLAGEPGDQVIDRTDSPLAARGAPSVPTGIPDLTNSPLGGEQRPSVGLARHTRTIPPPTARATRRARTGTQKSQSRPTRVTQGAVP